MVLQHETLGGIGQVGYFEGREGAASRRLILGNGIDQVGTPVGHSPSQIAVIG